MDSNKILRRLQEHRAAVEADGQKVIFIGLVGSQNYGLETEESDIDSKAIVLPSFKDIVLKKPLVSYTHIMENEEQIDVKDIRLMFEIFKKQNINFLELLFTPYCLFDKEYSKYLRPVFEYGERIVRYDTPKFLNTVCGMAREKYHALEHRYPSTEWKIDKWGYDAKQLHHIVRLYYFLVAYSGGMDFEYCLTAISSSAREFMMDLKKNDVYSLEEARKIAVSYLDGVQEMKEKITAQLQEEGPLGDHYRARMNPPKDIVGQVFEKALIGCLGHKIKGELSLIDGI